ncbi:unnamed protein product [Ascophyllum nodosum]
MEESSMSLGLSAADASGVPSPPTAEIRRTLLSAVEELSNHGLKLAAKWAAEQLVGLPDETPDEQPDEREYLRNDHVDADVAAASSTAASSAQPADRWLEGRVLFAKTLMDIGEFERAAKAFGDKPIPVPVSRGTGSSGGDSARGALPRRARFIRWYSLYLAGERRREEESQLTDALQRRRLVNPFLPSLVAELSKCDAEGSLDAFGLFMYAAVLKAMRGEGRGHGADIPVPTPPVNSSATPARMSGFSTPIRAKVNSHNTPRPSRAGKEGMKTRPPPSGVLGSGLGLGSAAKVLEVLERSLRLFPHNWSAWLDMATLCLETDSVPESLESDPPCHWMFQFFLQHLLVEQHRSKDALAILEGLQPSFPGSSYVLSQTAVAQYHQRNFDQGHEDFKELRRRDPLRMEGLEIFSNILYVKECKAELSFLAHTTVKSAPLRPETNCIIGNYYSLKGKHEKAVMYFLKALKVDRRCLSAWTLMGHEFVELKNSGAAIESYRQAVDINPKDYRAWYGLGQAYEILQMHLYATYYYRRATALRPYDARMWVAMGNCLEKLGKRGEAISTYERATANDDREGVAVERLAKLYSAEGKKEKAARCFEEILAKAARGGSVNTTAIEDAMVFLCYYYKTKGDFKKTSKMAHGLLDFTGTSREEALAVLREIRSIMEARQQQGGPRSAGASAGIATTPSPFTPDPTEVMHNASQDSIGDGNLPTPHSDGPRGLEAGGGSRRDRISSIRMRGGGVTQADGSLSLGGDDLSGDMSLVSDDDAVGIGERRGVSRGVGGFGADEGLEESASDILSP